MFFSSGEKSVSGRTARYRYTDKPRRKQEEANSMKQFTVVVCSLLMVLLAGTLVAAEEYKIGYVDLQRALNESSAGKQAKEKFTAEVKRAESDILRRKDEVEKLGASLEKQSSMLKDDARADKEKQFIQMQKDYERKVKDAKDELQIKDAQLTKGILEDLVTIIKNYGKENKYTIIFEKSETVLLYATESIDLTDKVLSLYDSQAKKR
jgi:outer membrane protein